MMPDNEAPVEVIQADRDAAGELWMQAVGIDDASQVDPNDGLAAAQLEEIAIAFARHRFAFSAAPADGEGELRPCPFCAATLSEPTLVRGTGQLFRFHPGVVTDTDCILAGKGFGGEDLAAWNRRAFATRAENAQVPHLADREAIAEHAFKAGWKLMRVGNVCYVNIGVIKYLSVDAGAISVMEVLWLWRRKRAGAMVQWERIRHDN